MKKFFLIHSLFGAILLCYCPHSMLGQDVDLQTKTEDDYVHGFVLNAQGEPLPYANITAWEGGQFLKGTASDQEGFFELAHCGGHLKINYIGYETKRLDLKELQEQPLVQLKEYTMDLATAVVTANGSSSGTGGCILTCSISCATKKAFSPYPNDTSDLVKWACFPNPTLDYVQVSTQHENGTLRLFSSQGHLLKEQLVQNKACRIDLSAYPPGAYVLSYERAGEKVLSKRVIKIIL